MHEDVEDVTRLYVVYNGRSLILISCLALRIFEHINMWVSKTSYYRETRFRRWIGRIIFSSLYRGRSAEWFILTQRT